MLVQLDIKNIALIDSVSMEFGSGLNILTGETGAGKSIIIDSINAILGERVSAREIIRTGQEKAVIEAVFRVDAGKLKPFYEETGIEPEGDGTVILSREMSVSGKNMCRLNGRMAPVSLLKRISEYIIDIHGQNDNQSLLRTENHIALLDLFAGSSMQKIKKQYLDLLQEQKEIKKELEKYSGSNEKRQEKADLLKYQIDEIVRADLKEDEDERLNEQRLLLINAEELINSLAKAYELLYSGYARGDCAFDFVGKAVNELRSIRRIGGRFDELLQKLEEISFQIEDITGEIRKERDSMEFDQKKLEQTEERIDFINALKRKYGSDIKQILEYSEKASKELEALEKSEEIVKELTFRLDGVNAMLYKHAVELNNERRKASRLLENEIGKQLEDLEMGKAEFKAVIEFNDTESESGERQFTVNGLDKIEFLISTNKGEPLKPLAKIASGGEMARIMLAIKNILAGVDEMPVLIFDEIDSGVSGKVAQKVGEKLYNISKNHQVICVTHLAQIACMADRHFLIQKSSDKDTTRTKTLLLDEKQRENEVARIIGGKTISEITLRHADEMLREASEYKKAKKPS